MMENFYLTSWDIFRIYTSDWFTLFIMAILPVIIPLSVLVVLWVWGVRRVRNRDGLRTFNRVMAISVVVLLIVIVFIIFAPLIMFPGRYGYSIMGEALTMHLPTGTYVVNLSRADICIANVTQIMRIYGFAYGPLGMGLFLVNGKYMNVFIYAPEGLRWIYVIKYGHETLGLYTPSLRLPIRCG